MHGSIFSISSRKIIVVPSRRLVAALHRNLSHTLYGQHIVVNHLIPALRSHYGNLHESGKPLVLSFHGTPGTGKNFVADRVAEHLYRHGARSAYVKKYLGRLHFPEASRVAEYAVRRMCVVMCFIVPIIYISRIISYISQRNLHADITAAIAACPRSLFIFDEVDKTPPGVFDRLASLMDHHSNIDKLDYRQATYIFLSNAGGLEIAERLLQHLEGGALRAESRLADYDAILTRTAYNEPGGLKRAAIIEAHLIDHYVPFLPLEREHVEACIRAEFRARGKEPSAELVA